MSDPLAVAWFLPVRHRDYDRMPASAWIRCLQLLPYLDRHGIRSVVNDRLARADVAVFVRSQDRSAQGEARAARARGARVVVDLCVNYFDETGLAAGGYGVTRERVEECRAMVAAADAVATASAFIAGRAAAFHPRVEYLPDSVDRQHFARTKIHERGRPPVAIWCGYSVKAAELEPVLLLLEKRGIPLVVVSDGRPRLPGRFEFVRWRHAAAPRDLLRGDVCVAPRDLDHAYNLGHSFFRIGVFLAQGVPVLAAPVPSYREVLAPGRNGLVCDSEDEWAGALDLITEDQTVLPRWSAEATRAMEPFWTEAVALRYARFFRCLVEHTRTGEGC